MRVLVTGGAGFIGSHTCLALLEKNYEVIVVDSYVNSHKKSLDRVSEILKLSRKKQGLNIEIINADVRDEKIMDKLFADSLLLDKPIQAVIHFSGLKSVKDSMLPRSSSRSFGFTSGLGGFPACRFNLFSPGA